jgi:hypothetical protein
MRWFIILIIFGIFLAPLIALSEEAPCKAEGATVVCTRTGFDTLVGKTIDFRKAAEKCVLEAESRTADMKVLDAKLALATSERDAARAEVEVWKTKPFPRSKMFAAVGLGAVAGVAGVGAAQVQSDVAAAGLGGLSLISLAAAVVLVVLE